MQRLKILIILTLKVVWNDKFSILMVLGMKKASKLDLFKKFQTQNLNFLNIFQKILRKWIYFGQKNRREGGVDSPGPYRVDISPVNFSFTVSLHNTIVLIFVFSRQQMSASVLILDGNSDHDAHTGEKSDFFTILDLI